MYGQTDNGLARRERAGSAILGRVRRLAWAICHHESAGRGLGYVGAGGGAREGCAHYDRLLPTAHRPCLALVRAGDVPRSPEIVILGSYRWSLERRRRRSGNDVEGSRVDVWVGQVLWRESSARPRRPGI